MGVLNLLTEFHGGREKKHKAFLMTDPDVIGHSLRIHGR